MEEGDLLHFRARYRLKFSRSSVPSGLSRYDLMATQHLPHELSRVKRSRISSWVEYPGSGYMEHGLR